MDPIAGLILGLAGSLHCAGMCGPIAAALPRGTGGGSALVMTRLTYNVGRILTYTALGVVIGLGGSVISLAGYGRALSILSGALMVVLALAQIIWHWNVPVPQGIMRRTAPIRRWLSTLMQSHSAGAMLGIGLLNGLLPCGMVTAALVGAAGMGSVLESGLFMAAFGLGTTPMMAALALAAPVMSGRWKSTLRVAAPVVALAMGVLITLRGMGLGIPMISPKPVTTTSASCCTSH